MRRTRTPLYRSAEIIIWMDGALFPSTRIFPPVRPRAEQDADVMGMEYAMVQVIDNRADVEGRVLAVRPDAARPHYHIVTLDVGAAAPVEGYPNVFADAAGKPLEISLPSDRVKSLVVGAAVRCRVRRAGPTTVIGDHCTPR